MYEKLVSLRIPETRPLNRKQTQKLAETQLTVKVLLLGGTLSFMFAFFFMYYWLIVADKLINSQNPLQSFLAVILPTAAFTVLAWGMRKLLKTTNDKSDGTKRTNVSYGAVSSDDDGHVKLPRNKEVGEDDANPHD